MNKVAALSLALISLLALCFAGIQPAKAQLQAPQLQWSKTYGPIGASGIIELEDGGFVIAAGTATFSSESRGYFNSTSLLIKTNSMGEVEWDKDYGANVSTESVIQTKDFGFALSGHSSITKTNAQGNIEWSKVTILFLESSKIIQANDGGYVLAGWTTNNDSHTLNAIVLKTDQDGNLLWNRAYGDKTNQTTANAIIETNDKSYAVAGNFGQSFWFTKIDSTGKTLWNRTYYYIDNSYLSPLTFYAVGETQDSGYILGGTDGKFAWLVKTDEQGNEIWHKRYNFHSFASVAKTPDGEFVAFGDTELVKLDSAGNVHWDEFYNSSDNFVGTRSYPPSTSARSGIITKDGGFAVAGSRIPDPSGIEIDVWAAKFAPESGESPSPSVPEFPTMIAVSLVIAATVLALRYGKKKQKPFRNP
jgi:hypothetical protein